MAKDLCAMTVDFETDWEGTALEGAKTITPRLLDFFDDHNIKATFFVQASLLEDKAILSILDDVNKKHEIASHGTDHVDLLKLDAAGLKKEIHGSRSLLEAEGFRCSGFRAPFFSVNEDVLLTVKEGGYDYDSSCTNAFFPGRKRCSPDTFFFKNAGIKELPAEPFTPLKVAYGLPFVRAFSPFSKLFIPKHPRMFYLHPCEFLETPPGKDVSFFVRQLYKRNRHDGAWKLLEDVVNRTESEFTSCRALLVSEQDI